MANHGVWHRRAGSLRSGLHDDVTHGDSLETRNQRWVTLAISTHDDTGPRARVLLSVVCATAGFTTAAEAAANPIANAERRSRLLSMESSLKVEGCTLAD
jgi:hypothetical protein